MIFGVGLDGNHIEETKNMLKIKGYNTIILFYIHIILLLLLLIILELLYNFNKVINYYFEEEHILKNEYKYIFCNKY